MVSVKYQSLFTITLLHDYYAGRPFEDVWILPDTKTEQLLKNQHIICRTEKNTLTAFAHTSNNQLFIPVDNGTTFRFYLKGRNTSFYNFSVLPKGMSYFSNKADNGKNNRLYLSAPVPAYKSTETYVEGDIVKQDNRVFECVKPNSKDDKHKPDDTTYWRDIVSSKILITNAYSDTDSYEPGNIVKAGDELFECVKFNNPVDKHNTADSDYWQRITEEAYTTKYDVWTSPDKSVPAGVFGVVDIVYGLGEKDAYAFTNNHNELLVKEYFIQFRNKSTYWKYISQKQTINAITDVNNVYAFSNAVKGNEFVSAVPVPLCYVPLQSLKMIATVNARVVEISGLQNPGVNSLQPLTENDSTGFVSEIYLNY